MSQLVLDAPLLTVPVDSARDHVLGPDTASVTLLEYGDYECPYCGRAHPVTKEIKRILGDELRFAFRHFPLTQAHPHSMQGWRRPRRRARRASSGRCTTSSSRTSMR